MIFLKHFFDFIFSLLLIILISPILLVIALMIKLEDGGKIFYKQERVGKNRKVFKIIKFRSMVENATGMKGGYSIFENDSRITRTGKFLRKTSLDELPQLFNILKGDMSFIGPRPPLTFHPKDYHEYEDWVLVRFKMRPGMTGLAQVNGRNDIDWYERFKYDVEYVKKWSLSYDVKILFETVRTLLSKKGIYGTDQEGK
ncbi:MAG TPA: sugar transferase [Thermotogota bacterium]|nr:sugar transferase [Thermotogota bacterium]HPR95378.1 sugar transferase [Thermotogota bacterium]